MQHITCTWRWRHLKLLRKKQRVCKLLTSLKSPTLRSIDPRWLGMVASKTSKFSITWSRPSSSLKWRILRVSRHTAPVQHHLERNSSHLNSSNQEAIVNYLECHRTLVWVATYLLRLPMRMPTQILRQNIPPSDLLHTSNRLKLSMKRLKDRNCRRNMHV